MIDGEGVTLGDVAKHRDGTGSGHRPIGGVDAVLHEDRYAVQCGTASPASRARSQASADAKASTSNTDRKVEPDQSISQIRSRKAWHN